MIQVEQLSFVFEEENKVQPEVEKEEPQEDQPADTSIVTETAAKSMYGSPIMMDEDITVYNGRPFETMVYWSPFKAFRKNLEDEDLLDLECFKNWAWDRHLNPLIEPEKTETVMSFDREGMMGYIKGLGAKDLDSLTSYCIPSFRDTILEFEWYLAMLDVGIQLATRIGIIRLGRAKIREGRKTWIGRNPLVGSPKLRLDRDDTKLTEMAEEFVQLYVGAKCKSKEWTLGYRGGLWRFVIGNKKEGHPVYMYIEEFDPEEI